jgi:integrase
VVLTCFHIDAFLSKLAVSRKTKKNIFSTLKLILKQGRAWGNLRENIWESAKKIGVSETEVRAYTDAEVESILSRSAGAKRLFYWLAAETGVRSGELCGLRVSDVDPFRKLVRVRQAVWRGKVQTPKTKNAIRDIPIPAQIVDALRVHIGGRTEGFVFTTKNGTAWNADLVLKRHLRGEAGSHGRTPAHVPSHVRNEAASRGSANRCCVQASWARQHLNHSQHLRTRLG